MGLRKKKELCPTCGASMMKNSYQMNKTLLRALVKLARSPGKRARDINMTKSEYAVYTKLKFWDLIRQVDDGAWDLTNTGRWFLQGKINLAKEVSYFRNKATDYSEEMVTVWDIIPTEESKQKYREMMQPYWGNHGN